MTTVKIAVAAIIALALGAAGGMYSAQARLKPELSQLLEQREDALARIEMINKKLADTEMLERENARLRRQVEDLRNRPEPVAPVAAPPGLLTEGPNMALGDASVVSPAEEEPQADERRGNWRPPEPGEAGYEEWQTRREEWRAERDERVADFRERMQGYFDEAMQQAPDAAVKNRIAAINEYSDYTMDLMREMRTAETEEERQAIREELGATWEASRALVREQQDYLLKETLKVNGVTNAQQQDRLVQAMRQTMEDPFFRMPGGGGPGGPWGGRGRGGDRGGN